MELFLPTKMQNDRPSAHLNDVDLLLTGRRKVDDLLHPRLVHTVQERDWGLKPHALMMIVMMIVMMSVMMIIASAMAIIVIKTIIKY